MKPLLESVPGNVVAEYLSNKSERVTVNMNPDLKEAAQVRAAETGEPKLTAYINKLVLRDVYDHDKLTEKE